MIELANNYSTVEVLHYMLTKEILKNQTSEMNYIYKELRMGGSKQKKYSLFAKQAQVFYIY